MELQRYCNGTVTGNALQRKFNTTALFVSFDSLLHSASSDLHKFYAK